MNPFQTPKESESVKLNINNTIIGAGALIVKNIGSNLVVKDRKDKIIC